MINTSRGLIVSKITASLASLGFIAILAKSVPSSQLGIIFEGLFISQSLVFLTDQGLTPTLVREQSSGKNLTSDFARISSSVKLRVKRGVLILPLLFLILCLLTDATLTSVAAICVSHIATLIYSTICAGLLGANLRFVETISEPLSRIFGLLVGGLALTGFNQFNDAQSIILVYAAADLFMLASVIFFYLRLTSSAEDEPQINLAVSRKFRTQSLLTGGTLNTVGLGESWALSVSSTTSDFAFYGLISRVVDISGLISSYAGYSHLPYLVSTIREQNWESFASRIRRIAIISLVPTTSLAVVILVARLNSVSFQNYDVSGQWLPLLSLALSIPAVVLSKYLVNTILALDPRALMFASFFTGLILTVGVFWSYQSFGLSGTLFVIAACNYLRSSWLFVITKRLNSRTFG
jgi:O-antigen/teichoic acid export membrane protein